MTKTPDSDMPGATESTELNSGEITPNSNQATRYGQFKNPVRLHIVGRKNSGKTTLVAELVSELTDRGFRVATIKHTHHHHELDTPGKDSHIHRRAGSAAVGILTPSMNAIFWAQDNETASLDRSDESTANQLTQIEFKETRYRKFETIMSDCDIILVEGDSQTSSTKFEVWRSESLHEPLCQTDPTIKAIIVDGPVSKTLPSQIILLSRSDLDSIIDFVLSLHKQNLVQPSIHQ